MFLRFCTHVFVLLNAPHCKVVARMLLTVMTLSFRTDRYGQTVQTQIRLLVEEQSDQRLHCLPFHFHNFDKISQGLASLFEF